MSFNTPHSHVNLEHVSLRYLEYVSSKTPCIRLIVAQFTTTPLYLVNLDRKPEPKPGQKVPKARKTENARTVLTINSGHN